MKNVYQITNYNDTLDSHLAPIKNIITFVENFHNNNSKFSVNKHYYTDEKGNIRVFYYGIKKYMLDIVRIQTSQ